MKSTLLDTIRKEQEEIQEDILNINTEDKTSDAEDETSDTASGSSSTPRNKDDELKKKIKTFLSGDTNSMIDANEEEIDEIIEKMKHIGIAKDKGLELQKLKNLKRGLKTITK